MSLRVILSREEEEGEGGDMDNKYKRLMLGKKEEDRELEVEVIDKIIQFCMELLNSFPPEVT